MADPYAEYPKALYRDGGEEEIWGERVETLICVSRMEEMEALAFGWRLHPINDDEPLTLTAMADEPTAKRRGRPPMNRTAIDA